MPRIARVVAPGFPHHITQRGNRRLPTFFNPDDYCEYKRLMKKYCDLEGVQIWCHCLMTNHTHMIAVPPTQEALAAAIGEAHRMYSRRINFREGWRGHLFQGRFGSVPMDNEHLVRGVRYILRNPVEAGMVERAKDYRWSSAMAHLTGIDDDLTNADPLAKIIGDWDGLLKDPAPPEDVALFEKHQATGRPLGSKEFVETLEELTERDLRMKGPGPLPSPYSDSTLSQARIDIE